MEGSLTEIATHPPKWSSPPRTAIGSIRWEEGGLGSGDLSTTSLSSSFPFFYSSLVSLVIDDPPWSMPQWSTLVHAQHGHAVGHRCSSMTKGGRSRKSNHWSPLSLTNFREKESDTIGHRIATPSLKLVDHRLVTQTSLPVCPKWLVASFLVIKGSNCYKNRIQWFPPFF